VSEDESELADHEHGAGRLTDEQLAAVCRRAFGDAARLDAFTPLLGGTSNETYRLEVGGEGGFVLRVAAPDAGTGDDAPSLRREYHALPYFAALGPLLPRTVFADFTRQVVGRDYVVQTLLEGERWSDIEGDLTEAESAPLWREFGEIARRIHAATGERFGAFPPGRSFAPWSECVLDRFARTAAEIAGHGLDARSFAVIHQIAADAAALLDGVRTPSLLHGDLWTFNLLVAARGDGSRAVTGVLDMEHAWWGDPLADWTMFLLDIRRDEAEWQAPRAAFFAGYGGDPAEADETARTRALLYKALHTATALVWYARHGDAGIVARSRRDVDAIRARLEEVIR
jgi:aminoglycoside phosphotransferase (APT) family kinase protein